MIMFAPRPCPCGCKKFIMAPTFACQCSSVDADERDELMAMQRDAIRYRALRSRSVGVRVDVMSSPLEAQSLDDLVDNIVRKEIRKC